MFLIEYELEIILICRCWIGRNVNISFRQIPLFLLPPQHLRESDRALLPRVLRGVLGHRAHRHRHLHLPERRQAAQLRGLPLLLLRLCPRRGRHRGHRLPRVVLLRQGVWQEGGGGREEGMKIMTQKKFGLESKKACTKMEKKLNKVQRKYLYLEEVCEIQISQSILYKTFFLNV